MFQFFFEEKVSVFIFITFPDKLELICLWNRVESLVKELDNGLKAEPGFKLSLLTDNPLR